MQRSRIGRGGWTFMELLLVMTAIAILIGIAYPSFIAILEQARKTQAKNEEQQIVTAVNAFYTDYGKYPLATDDSVISNNADLFFTLRAVPSGANAANAVNTRAIVFIQPPISKTGTKGGIDGRTTSPTFGAWFDPWGSQYQTRIDGNYDNQLANPYADAPGGTTLYLGVIVWSLGKNGALGGGVAAAGFSAENGTPNNFTNSGDVISWQ
jgi:Tfp pilus assembly protein PilE